MNNTWQYVGLAVFTVAAMTVGIVATAKTSRKKRAYEAEVRAWDFRHLTDREARDMFFKSAAKRPRDTWVHIHGGYYVRLTEVTSATLMLIAPSLKTYGNKWPMTPGAMVRVRLFYVSAVEAIALEWLCNVVVDEKADITTPYDFVKHMPTNQLGTEPLPIDADHLGRWAKRLGLEPRPEDLEPLPPR